MPFPVDKKYIVKTEEKLDLKFPEIYKSKMMIDNGGELEGDDYFFMLNPFFDESNRKRISRTCNDIIKETESAKEYGEIFPKKGIAIGKDNCGNLLLLMPVNSNILGEEIFLWDHETSKITKIANNIIELL